MTFDINLSNIFMDLSPQVEKQKQQKQKLTNGTTSN